MKAFSSARAIALRMFDPFFVKRRERVSKRESEVSKQPIAIVLPILLFAIALSGFTISCQPKEESTDKVRVAVSILPQAEFVEAVAGGRVNITVMVPPGANPHIYEPKPAQMAELAKVKMYAKVGSGIEFELAWMDKLAGVNREMMVVDCSKGVTLIATDSEQTGQQHGAPEPHIWMSPLNAKIMVQNITDGLSQIDPANKANYEQNRDAYLKKLTRLDEDIKSGLSAVTNRRFIIYHPVLGYFAKEYNLTQIAIEEEGKEPTAARIASAIEQAKKYNIKVIFATPQFNPKNAETIAKEIGGRVVFIDDLAKDYIDNLRRIQSELVAALQ